MIIFMTQEIVAVHERLEEAEIVRRAMQEFLELWRMDSRYEVRLRHADGMWRVILLDHMPSFPAPKRAQRMIARLRERLQED